MGTRLFLITLSLFSVVISISLFLSFFSLDTLFEGWTENYTRSMFFIFLWGIVGALLALFLMKPYSFWALPLHAIDSDTKDERLSPLIAMLEEGAKKAGFSKPPRLAILRSHDVNAFATGSTPSSSMIALSTGLLTKLNSEEIRGVMAHHLVKIKNGDVATLEMLAGVRLAFLFLPSFLLFFFSRLIFRSERPARIFLWMIEAVTLPVSRLIHSGFSRAKDFEADLKGADLLGAMGKLQMTSTLRALERNTTQNSSFLASSFQSLLISSPGKQIPFLSFHPSLKKRRGNLA